MLLLQVCSMQETSRTSLKPMNLSGSSAGGAVGAAASACAVLACTAVEGYTM